MPVNFEEFKRKAREIDSANGAINFNLIREKAKADDAAGINTRSPEASSFTGNGTTKNNATAAQLLVKGLLNNKNKSQTAIANARAYTDTDEFKELLKGDSYLDNEVPDSGLTLGGDPVARARAKQTGKKFNATDEERAVQDAKDLDFATKSGFNRFIAGLAQGISYGPTNRYSWQEESESEKALDELIDNTGAGQAGKLVGEAVQYAVPYMAGSKAVGAATKAIPGVAKLGKAGQSIVQGAAADILIGAPLNANYVWNKEGLRGDEAFTEFIKQEGLDLVLGVGLEALGNLLGKTLKSGKTLKTANDIANATEEEIQEMAETLAERQYRLARESNIRKGKLNETDDVIELWSADKIADERGLPAPLQENKNYNPRKRGLQTTANFKLADSEYRKAIESLAEYIRNYKGKGGGYELVPVDNDYGMPQYIKAGVSNNDAWYQDFYKQYGRPPRKSEADELAQQLIDEGLTYPYAEFSDPDLTAILNRPMSTTVPKARRLEDSINEYVDKGYNIDNTRGKALTDEEIAERQKELFGKELPRAKDLGADTNRILPTVEENAERFGTFKNSTIPKGTEFGETSQAAKTVYDNAIRSEEAKKLFNEDFVEGTFSKHYKSNQTTVDNVNKVINEEGIDKAYDKFNKELADGNEETIALGARLIQELQKTSDNDKLMSVVTDYIDLLSRRGRELQAGSIIKRLTPEGRLVTVQRQAKKVAEVINATNPNKQIQIKLSDDIINAIKNAKSEKEILEANKKASIEIWDQVPATLYDKLNAWRYISMLTNPRTWARNMAGNELFRLTRAVKDALGTGLEKMFIKNGERTKAILTPNDKQLLDAAANDWIEVGKIAYKNGGEYSSKTRPPEARVFNSKWLENLRKLSSDALEWQDEKAGGRAYKQAFAKYMKANNISVDMLKTKGVTVDELKRNTEIIERIRTHALKEAERATFRESTAISNAISKAARRKNNSLPQTAKSMFIEGVLPFKKTPVNILWRGIEYSPAGYIEAAYRAYNYKKHGLSSVNEVIDALAAGTTGTGLLALGGYLYKIGMLNAGNGTSNKDYYEEMLGKQSYSITLADGTYTIDWVSPAAMPLLVGAEIASMAEGNDVDFVAVIDGLSKIADPLIETSMLKGLNDALRYNYGENPLLPAIGNIFLSYANQFVPTASGQIARILDGTRRSTVSTNESPTLKALEKAYNKNIAKLPGLSQTLPEYVDVWGRTENQGNAFEQFISPGYYAKNNITAVDKEIMNLAEYDDSVYPTLYYKYDQVHNGKTYRLSPDDLSQFQKTAGQYRYKELDKLIKTQDYKNASDDDKVKMIKDIYDEANALAKAEFLTSQGVSQVSAYLNEKQQGAYSSSLGMSAKEFRAAINDAKAKADTDKNGNLKNAEVKAYLDSTYKDDVSTKRALYAAIMPSNYNNSY